MHMATQQYDIVVFGASSFVGQILTRYLWKQYGLRDLNWAIAGRSSEKLNQLKQSLGHEDARNLPVVTADAGDEASLRQLCEQARLVVSTVGPYALYGEGLVKACAESGTDYCDLTGEVQWMKRMIERYQVAAQSSGARLVHACGFDSIPSDLGVWFCQQQAREKFGETCQHIKMRVRKIRGGLSGGTVASVINGAREAMADPDLRRQLRDPYALCPPDHGYWARQHNPQAEYDADLHSWVGPFIMSSINTRVVFRSNALSGDAYGKDFRYDEGSLTGADKKGMWRARGVQAGMGLFGLGVVLPPTRWVLERFVLPKPGEGPSPRAQEKGYWEMDFFGRLRTGQSIHVLVTGDRDPGYGSTAKMLGQAAMCLAFGTDREAVGGGFWTPATAMDGKLIPRLEQHAGLSFRVIG
jgi:short subunit dehydrogenase-like uncharacterized protein